jgi:hypothetical protein
VNIISKKHCTRKSTAGSLIILQCRVIDNLRKINFKNNLIRRCLLVGRRSENLTDNEIDSYKNSTDHCINVKIYSFFLNVGVHNLFFSLLVLEGVIIESRIDPRSRISLPRLIIFYY